MKNRIRFISHKGKKILLVDCSKCTVEQLIELAALVPVEVTSQPHGSVLLLADFTGASFDRNSVDRLNPAGLRPAPPETFRMGGSRAVAKNLLRTPEIFFAEGITDFQDARGSDGLAGRGLAFARSGRRATENQLLHFSVTGPASGFFISDPVFRDSSSAAFNPKYHLAGRSASSISIRCGLCFRPSDCCSMVEPVLFHELRKHKLQQLRPQGHPAKDVPRRHHINAALAAGDGRHRGQRREPVFPCANCFQPQVGQNEINCCSDRLRIGVQA